MGGPHKPGDKQRTYWISPDMEARFKEFAKSQGISMSELIRISIDFYRQTVQEAKTPTTTPTEKGENDNGHQEQC